MKLLMHVIDRATAPLKRARDRQAVVWAKLRYYAAVEALGIDRHDVNGLIPETRKLPDRLERTGRYTGVLLKDGRQVLFPEPIEGWEEK